MRRDVAVKCGRFTTCLRLSAFIGSGRANKLALRRLPERIAMPPVVNDAIADVDDAVDAADVSFSSQIAVICDTTPLPSLVSCTRIIPE